MTKAKVIPSKNSKGSLLVAIGLKNSGGLEGMRSDFNTKDEEMWGPGGSRDSMIWRPSVRRGGGR